MRAKIRTTGAGTEYWDNIEKRIIFVPNGSKPNFEVTDEYESLIHKEEKKEVEKEPDLERMNLKQLKEHAASLEIELPNEAKTKDQIKSIIKGEEAAEE